MPTTQAPDAETPGEFLPSQSLPGVLLYISTIDLKKEVFRNPLLPGPARVEDALPFVFLRRLEVKKWVDAWA